MRLNLECTTHPYRAGALRDKSEILEALSIGEYTNGLKSSGPVGETHSFLFKLCTVHGLGEHVCMHKVRAHVLDNDVAICHPFRNPETTNAYVTGYLGPGSPAFHERHACT